MKAIKAKKSKVAKSKKSTKAKKMPVAVATVTPVTLDRKQASRLNKNAHVFSNLKTAKKVLINKKPIGKTEATSKILQAILGDFYFKVFSDEFDDVFDIEIR